MSTDWEAYEAAVTLLPEDDQHHPLTVLGTWELMLREDYDLPSHERITVSTAAAFLDRLLHRIANDPEQDWPLFAREIRTCRTHLETVLHDSRQPERGAPCYMCGEARVEKKHREQRHINCHGRNGCKRQDRAGYCLDAEQQRIPDDGYECPACKVWYSPHDYEQTSHIAYVQVAEELTLADMAIRTGVTYSTLRRWASVTRTQVAGQAVVEHEPRIRVARIEGGRKVYRVAEVEALMVRSGA